MAAIAGIGSIEAGEIERRRERVRRAWTYHRVDHLPIRVQHPCFQPLLDELHKGFIIHSFFQHPLQPLVRDVVEERLDVRFYHKVVPPELQLDGQFVYRIQWADVRAIPIATAQKILLVDGSEYPRCRQL